MKAKETEAAPDAIEKPQASLILEATPEVEAAAVESADKAERIQVDYEILEEQTLQRIADDQFTETLQAIEDVEKIEAVISRRALMMDRIRFAAIKTTNPEDWILSKPNQETPIEESVAMLAASGCRRVAVYYGIELTNKRPANEKTGFSPERIEEDNGIVTFRMWLDGGCKITGLRQDDLEVAISSREQFTGRSVDKSGKISTDKDAISLEQDLRAALQTRAESKIIRILTGLIGVPGRELATAWDGTPKSLERCRLGMGFGTSSNRKSAAPRQEGVAQKSGEFWADIQRAVNGNLDAAHDILRQVTRFDKSDGTEFQGIKSVDSFKSVKFLDESIERWKNHEMNPRNAAS